MSFAEEAADSPSVCLRPPSQAARRAVVYRPDHGRAEVCSQNISVREMLRILSPNRDAERRTAMAVVQVYGDESYDNKNRIYVVAAYLATDSAWETVG